MLARPIVIKNNRLVRISVTGMYQQRWMDWVWVKCEVRVCEVVICMSLICGL